MACLFTFIMGYFEEQKFLIVLMSSLLIVSSHAFVFIKNSAKPMVIKIFSYVFSKHFVALGLYLGL